MVSQPAKRRRLPSRGACIDCRRRKHRCDGVRPECGGCRSRWIACRYPSNRGVGNFMPHPSSEPQPEHPDLPQRHSTQEQGSLLVGLQQQQNQSQPLGQSPSPNSTPHISPGGINLLWSSATNLMAPGSGDPPPVSPIATPSSQAGPHATQSRVLEPLSPNESTGPDGFFGDSSTFAFVSKVHPNSQESNGVHLQTHQHQGLPECDSPQSSLGATMNATSGTSQLIPYQLPERRLADSLVDGYFERVHPLYPFVHEGSFRAEYENTWTHPPTTSLRASWIALLNIVFALGCEFSEAIPDGSITTVVSPFVGRSREIILSHIYRKGNLEFVQALLLMCHYLQGTMELNECWNLVGLMIRTAVSIGLQLNPENLGLSTVAIEVRKRVWWGCFIIDRTLSMKFGRPRALQSTDAHDVPLPLSIDDQYIRNESSSPRQPASHPSTVEFFVHTIRLSKIIDRILQHLYTTNRKNLLPGDSDTATPARSEQSEVLSRVILLDGQLQSWWDDTAVHLRPESTVGEGKIFQRQRAVMLIRYLQIRILLQRPLLLMFSRHDIADDFLRAIVIAGSHTCIDAARQTLQLINRQYHCRLLNSLWYNLHYVFTSMGVLLHLQTLNTSKLELLGSDLEQEAMDRGMEFLKAASQTSGLAAKYASMLQRIRNEAKDEYKENHGMDQNTLGIPLSQRNYTEATQGISSSSSQDELRTHELQILPAEAGMDLDGWLLGVGLPQHVLPFDDFNSGYLV